MNKKELKEFLKSVIDMEKYEIDTKSDFGYRMGELSLAIYIYNEMFSGD